MVPLVRAVLVWVVVLSAVVFPRVQPAANAPSHPIVSQVSAYSQQSVMGGVRDQRIQTAQIAQANAWASEYNSSFDGYQARLQAEAEIAAEAARIAALSNHPPPPAYIAKIIHDAFVGLGDRAVTWAFNVAYCESRYHPTSVNSSSGASGLFQFLPSTWAFTPWHQYSPFDPVANAHAAAWLYQRDGPSQWECQG